MTRAPTARARRPTPTGRRDVRRPRWHQVCRAHHTMRSQQTISIRVSFPFAPGRRAPAAPTLGQARCRNSAPCKPPLAPSRLSYHALCNRIQIVPNFLPQTSHPCRYEILVAAVNHAGRGPMSRVYFTTAAAAGTRAGAVAGGAEAAAPRFPAEILGEAAEE